MICDDDMFQLGEILKAYGHFQEAALHLRHVLELRPNHEPALAILKEMEASPDSTVHVYTLLIIGKQNRDLNQNILCLELFPHSETDNCVKLDL